MQILLYFRASSTAVSTNQTFYALYNPANGNTIVADTVQFNSLPSAGLSFDDASVYAN